MKHILIALFLLLCTINLQAQQGKYFKGLLLDDSAYARIPQKPALLTRSYDILPQSYSLRQYCPLIKDQGVYSTCTSWSSTYAARTIAEAIANNWQDRALITKEAFSPLFIYALTKIPNDVNCQEGIYLNTAFQMLKDRGAVKFSDFNYTCTSTIPNDLFSQAAKYTIDNYFALFEDRDVYSKKVSMTKKSIAENRPVVISMACYRSFDNDNEEVWNGVKDAQEGYHAMCVVGYDDNKSGGAFLLMNSWGTQWGDQGFKWVKYADYSQNVNYAMEMYVRAKTPPKPVYPVLPEPQPKPQSKSVDLAGELHFILSTGEEMRSNLRKINNLFYYKLEGSYISGTRYRLYLSNHEPAYVYIIGSDLRNSVSKVFPPNDKISPALVYKSNDIAIPDENWYIEMDNTKGSDYVCVLYSKDELPVNDIVAGIKVAPGSFFDKVNQVLSAQMVPPQTVNYGTSTISFSVKNTDKTLVPIIVEIEHQ